MGALVIAFRLFVKKGGNLDRMYVFSAVLFHHFDRFVGEYDLRFEKHYGKWRGRIPFISGKVFGLWQPQEWICKTQRILPIVLRQALRPFSRNSFFRKRRLQKVG